MASFVALQCQVKYASPEDSCKLVIQACGSDDYVERYAYIIKAKEEEKKGIETTLLSTPPHYCFHSNTQTTFLSSVTPIQNLFFHNNNFKVPCFSLDPSQLPLMVVVGSANADIYVEVDQLLGEGETLVARSGQTLVAGKGANPTTCSTKLTYLIYFIE
ncbi:hypothetical protein HKD37_17G048876 [Glycine soja]